MEKKEIIQNLLESAGRQLDDISAQNLFREIGFDNGKPRLGWVLPPPWQMIEMMLAALAEIITDKEQFIFIGMGGSINGIKSVLFLKQGYPLYPLDSLDPAALQEIVAKIKGKQDKTLVIAISKSGSTKETLLLAETLRELFKDAWRDHFLWLADKESFPKLDSAGWQGCPKFTIQVDGNSDIGGRFTCPHTLIFLLPLFILLNRDAAAVKRLFLEYVSMREEIMNMAYEKICSYKQTEAAFFSIEARRTLGEGFITWTTQLFQESLGSKKDGFYVKTALGKEIKGFNPICFDLHIQDKIVYLMGLMYFLQCCVAFYAYFKKINFVNQPSVEVYKQRMQQLQDKEITLPDTVVLERLMKDIESRLTPAVQFIEVVLYFHPQPEFISVLRERLTTSFPQKKAFVFLGSDWNHHSYQAAFKDKTSLYVILSKKEYLNEVRPFRQETIDKNTETLKRISFATYKTLSDRALYFSL